MTSRTAPLDDRLYAYLLQAGVPEPDAFRPLREETQQLPNGGMQISPEQGAFMALLVELIGARRALEIGVFTGYSSLWVASALPEDGKLVCCDINKEYTDIARRHWRETGLDDRIELRMGPALDSLDDMLAQGQQGTFDFAFVDADKRNTPNYYERVLALLRPGGVMVIDNAFLSGRVANPEVDDEDTRATRQAIDTARQDPRVTACLLPVSDGLLLVRKR